jgi:hypothetical protein
MGSDMAEAYKGPILSVNHAADLCRIMGLDPERILEASLVLRPESVVTFEVKYYVDNGQMLGIQEKVRAIVEGRPSPGINDRVAIIQGPHKGRVGRIKGRTPVGSGLEIQVDTDDGIPGPRVEVFADEVVHHGD